MAGDAGVPHRDGGHVVAAGKEDPIRCVAVAVGGVGDLERAGAKAGMSLNVVRSGSSCAPPLNEPSAYAAQKNERVVEKVVLEVHVGRGPTFAVRVDVAGWRGVVAPVEVARRRSGRCRRERRSTSRPEAREPGLGWRSAEGLGGKGRGAERRRRHATASSAARGQGRPTRRSIAAHGWCAWQESNLLPLAPQASALSGELQARAVQFMRASIAAVTALKSAGCMLVTITRTT